MANSFSKTYVDFWGREERTLKVEVNGRLYVIEPTTGINDACGYTSFKMNGVYHPEGIAEIPEGQLQISWEEDDLNVFFYSYDHPEGVVVQNERLV